jgi:hypothetical protein
MPKCPVREIFCAMRVALRDFSTVCLIFDCKGNDLKGSKGLLDALKYTWTHDHAMHNPLGVLILLTVHCGRTSELNRVTRENEVVTVETRTDTTEWTNPNEKIVKSPTDYLRTIIFAHHCHNNLVSLSNAVAFEIETWKFIQALMNDGTLGWRKRILKAECMWIADEIKYHLQRTKNRKAQIRCLQTRISIQINLV